VRCRWKGLVKSFLMMQTICTLWTFNKHLQNVHQTFTKRSSNGYKTKRSSNVLKTFTKCFQNVLNQNVFKTFSIKTFSKRSQSKRSQSQKIHKTFTTHSLSHFGFTPWLYPFWTVYYNFRSSVCLNMQQDLVKISSQYDRTVTSTYNYSITPR
jgi:hypothetical protein